MRLSVSVPLTLRIGARMFEALKHIYTASSCIIRFIGEISQQFQTFCGIKQGANTSVLLFITFMDGAINYLKAKCDPEPILEDIHCLLHADDTVILSTDHKLFIKKCNHLIDYFNENKLNLNINKSAYMIVNSKKQDGKQPLKLKSGDIEYRSTYTYLGAPITDSGYISKDLKEHLKVKRPNVLVKLSRFISNNIHSPFAIKKKVLKACVNSSLLYGCEIWADANLLQL